MPREYDEEDLLDDLEAEEDETEEEAEAEDEGDKPETTEQERIDAAVAKALADRDAKEAKPAAPAKEEKPFHPGLTPTEIHASSVQSSVSATTEFMDTIDEAMDQIDEAVGDSLTAEDKKAIRKQLRALTPDALKATIAQKAHLHLAKSEAFERSKSQSQAKRRNGVGAPPIGAKGSSPRGGGNSRGGGLSTFESMYGKTDKSTQRELRRGGHI